MIIMIAIILMVVMVISIQDKDILMRILITLQEEQKCNVIAEEVARKQKDCEQDLAKAEPALIAANEALDTLNKVWAELIINIHFS